MTKEVTPPKALLSIGQVSTPGIASRHEWACTSLGRSWISEGT